MRTLWIIFIAILFLSISCRDEREEKVVVCGTPVSIEETPWLRELRESISSCSCLTSIVQGTYKGQTVIWVQVSDPRCNSIFVPTLYNCNGEVVKTITTSEEDQEDARENLRREVAIYTCK